MKEPPSQTFAHLLRGPVRRSRASSSPAWNGSASRTTGCGATSRRRRRHFFNKRVSLVNYVVPGDAARGDARRRLGERDGAAAGRRADRARGERPLLRRRCSLTLVLHGDGRRARCEQQTAEAMKVMAVHDGSLFEETYNLLNAWLSIVPGNGAHNLRRLALLETNLADLSFLFTLDQGEPREPASGARGARRLRDAAPDAVRLQPARGGRRPHAGARRDGQRQELPAELPGDARAEVRPAHGHPRSRPQLPEARDAAARAAIWSSGLRQHERHDQPVRARARRRSTCISCTRSSACCSKATTGTG